MEPIDDEDVIIKGGPLYEHLTKVGFVDYEVIEKSGHLSATDKDDAVPYEVKTSPLRRLLESVSHLCCIPFSFHRQCAVWENSMFQSHCYNTIISSSNLLLEDAVFVRNMMEEFQNKHLKPNIWDLFLSALIPVVPSLGIFCHYCLHNEFSGMYQNPSVLLASLAIVLCLGELLRGSLCFINLLISKSTFDTFIASEEKHVKLLKKSIRAIQEMALASKGFSYKLNSQSSKLLEHASDHHLGEASKCVGLRQTIFTNCLYGINVFSKSTVSLIKKVPLLDGVDVSANYLSLMDFEELVLRELKQEKEHSLHTLKRLTDILILLQSENLRRFCLCLIPSLLRDGTKQRVAFYTYLSLLPQSEVSVLEENILMSFQIQQCSLLNRNDKTKWTKNQDNVKPISKVDKLLSHVHNLDLHLQASLLRVRSLQSLLQSIPSDDLLLEHQKQIEEEIERGRREIEASLQFLEDTRGYFCCKNGDRVSYKERVTKESEETVSGGNMELIDRDPVIVDEVFEAFVTGAGGDLYTEAGLDMGDEAGNGKLQREQANQVLRELRSILTVKAAEMKEREKIALKRHAGEELGTSGDSSSSLAPSEEFQNDVSGTEQARIPSEASLSAQETEYNTDTSVTDNSFVKPLPLRNHPSNRMKPTFTIGELQIGSGERLKTGIGFEAVQVASGWLQGASYVEDSFGDDLDEVEDEVTELCDEESEDNEDTTVPIETNVDVRANSD